MRAFVQWKGSTVCADMTCECGGDFHIDADFAYFIRCPDCGKIFEMPSDLTLKQVEPPKDAHLVKDWLSGLGKVHE